MNAPFPNSWLDRIDTCLMGMHSGLSITLLPPQQLSMAVNATMRGGHPGTRPRMAKLRITYANGVQTNATQALFQGAAFYKALGNNPDCLLASIGGHLFRYIITNNNVVVDDITPFLADGITRDLNDPTQPQAWLAQGQDFMVIQDGQSNPWFFDGSGVRRSQGAINQELPAGRQIHYCNGRFITVLPNAISYIASDLVYNTDSGTAQYNYRDSILRTKDNKAILGGLAFGVPLTAGHITSLFSVAIPDTSLGQGPLQIGTTDGVFSVNLPLDATLWTTTEQPSQTVSLPNGGPTGFYAVTTVNGDAWYRGGDGLRSFVVARRDFNTWVQTSLSFELQRILPYDTKEWLSHASAVTFDNRFLCTASPLRVNNRGIAHRGLVALDFNNVSSITTRSQPAYDGLWTGIRILQIVKGKFNGVDRCFLFALDADDNITLYEIAADGSGYFDNNGIEDVPIQSWIESGALFGREGSSDRASQSLKRLTTGDIFVERLFGPTSVTPPGQVGFTIQYRSDANPCWVDWHTFNLCAPSCYTPETCAQPVQVREQYATFQRLPEPGGGCNSITGRPHRTGYYFQIKLAWTGHAELHRLNVWAEPLKVQDTKNVVCSDAPCQVLTCCEDDLFSYSIESSSNPPSCNLEIIVQPQEVTAEEGETINLTFVYDGAAGSVSIQWYKDGVALVDGPSGGSTISGSTTATLTITNAEPANDGQYYAIVTQSEDCTVQTDTVEVTVNPGPEPPPEPSMWWKMDEINEPIVGGYGPATDRAEQIVGATLFLASGTVRGAEDSVNGTASANFQNGAAGVLDTLTQTEFAYNTGDSISISYWTKMLTALIGDEVPRFVLQFANGSIAIRANTGGVGTDLEVFLVEDSPFTVDVITINNYSPIIDQWYHWVVVYDGATGLIKFYIDTVLIGTSTTPIFIDTSADGYLRFTQPNAFSTAANVDEVKLWLNHALTQDEIDYLFANP